LLVSFYNGRMIPLIANLRDGAKASLPLFVESSFILVGITDDVPKSIRRGASKHCHQTSIFERTRWKVALCDWSCLNAHIECDVHIRVIESPCPCASVVAIKWLSETIERWQVEYFQFVVWIERKAGVI